MACAFLKLERRRDDEEIPLKYGQLFSMRGPYTKLIKLKTCYKMYVGPNLVFCCSSAPLTVGVTDRQTDIHHFLKVVFLYRQRYKKWGAHYF